MDNSKIVSINEIKYKKYGHINYDNTVPVAYKLIHKIYNKKRNIRKEMIKGYMMMLSNYNNK